MNNIDIASKKVENISDKKPKTLEEYVPSASSFEGEILVKGKHLGRWSPKKFTLDPENKFLIL